MPSSNGLDKETQVLNGLQTRQKGDTCELFAAAYFRKLGYLVFHKIFFNKNLTNLMFALYSFFAISMSINMFITGGRAGQVAFFAMLCIFIFQLLDKKEVKVFSIPAPWSDQNEILELSIVTESETSKK